MNIYQPYDEMADAPDKLHLKLNDARERAFFTVYRAVPVALFLLAWYVLQQLYLQIPMGFNYLLILCAAASIIFLLFRSYITELKIAPGNIFLIQKTITGARQLNIPIDEAAFVALYEKKGGGGVSFILYTKSKQRFMLMRIPVLWVDEKHVLLIAETLRQLLGVTVRRK